MKSTTAAQAGTNSSSEKTRAAAKELSPTGLQANRVNVCLAFTDDVEEGASMAGAERK